MFTKKFDPPREFEAGEFKLALHFVRVGPDGSTQVVLDARRGDALIHTDRVRLSDSDERKRFVREVRRYVEIDEQVIHQALLRILSALSAQLLDDDTKDTKLSYPSTPRRKNMATLITDLAEDLFFFHTPNREAFVTFDRDGHNETWPLESTDFRTWLERRFHVVHKIVPNATAVREALSALRAKALYEGPRIQVFTRNAHRDGEIFLDLANDEWEVVRITSEGWEVISDPQVRFRRHSGTLDLPYPARNGRINELRPFLNLNRDSDWVMVVAWILGALRGLGPFPVLCVHGEQGSGKSTLERVIRSILDPSTTPLRTQPRDERDLFIAASNSYCMAFDNFSHLPAWRSDALCRLSTGGGFSTRELYSDRNEILLDVQRPIMLNGIEDVVNRGNLLDRSLVIYHAPISDEKRTTEHDFYRRLEEARPRILGAYVDAVVAALRGFPNTHPPALPRLADLGQWVAACEPHMGWQAGTFLSCYKENKENANLLALEASPLTEPMRKLIERRDWEGTSKALLKRLSTQVEPSSRRSNGWPANESALGGALRRLAPNLRVTGINVEFWRESGGNRERMLRISRRSR